MTPSTRRVTWRPPRRVTWRSARRLTRRVKSAARGQSALAAVALLVLIVFLSGCDNLFDPFVDEERFFVLNGYLDNAADTQFVRLNTLRQQALLDTTVDISVRSVHGESGATVHWQDSLVQLDDGALGRLFYGLFTPGPGGTYTVTAEAPGIRTTEVTTTLPEAPVLDPGRTDSVCANGDTTTIQIIEWQQLDRRPRQAELTYSVRIPETGSLRMITLDYGTYRSPVEPCSAPEVPGPGVYGIFLEGNLQIILNRLDRRFDQPRPILEGLRMRISVLSNDWGVGAAPSSFGSVIDASASWVPACEAIARAGYGLPAASSCGG